MKRTRKKITKKPDAILCSDLHLTEATPVCRSDDYLEAQKNKLIWLSDLQKQYKCPVLCAGDIFDHWKPSPFLISFALQYLPGELLAIPGQHDLPQHNLELIDKSGFYSLVEAKKLLYWIHSWTFYQDFNVKSIPFGQPIKYDGHGEELDKKSVLMLHQLTWKGEPPFPGADPAGNAKRLLKQNENFDLILTGDNHIPFTEEYEGRLLVNPGSMMRSTAKQIDHKPRVYLWNAESNTATPAYFPIEEGVVSREHIEVKEIRSKRLDAFVSAIMDKDFAMEISFEKNIKRMFQTGKVPKRIQEKVMEAMGL